MIPADETFDGTWPYEARYFEGNGFRQHYIDEGPRDTGETFALLHGEPTWGYIWRRFIPRLSARGRIVLIDSFMKAMMEPEQAAQQPADSTPWMSFIQSDAFEPAMSPLGSTIVSVLYKVGLAQTGNLDETWVRPYGAPFPTPAECRGALQFPRNLLLPETWTYLKEGKELPGAMEAIRSKSALLIHGELDPAVPAFAAELMFRMIWPSAPIVTVPGASHYVQQDAPETAIALIKSFVQTLG